MTPVTGRPFREVTNILDAAPEKDRHCAVNLTSPHVLSLRHHHHRHPGLMVMLERKHTGDDHNDSFLFPWGYY